MLIEIPEDLKAEPLFKFLKDNKKQLISQKKSVVKHFDGGGGVLTFGVYTKEDGTSKAAKTTKIAAIPEDATVFNAKTAANTSMWVDSYRDVLLRDSAKKSMKERKGMIPHIHDHEYKVGAEVGEVRDIYYMDVPLRELGLKKEGTAQVLVFDTDIMKAYNEMVFNKYKAGKIKQHSIGLQYVRMELAINMPGNEYYEEEYKEWEKWYGQLINPEVADVDGYFWVIYEYKLIENSCVLIGANFLTPTLEVTEAKTETTVDKSHDSALYEPVEEPAFDLDAAIKQTKFII